MRLPLALLAATLAVTAAHAQAPDPGEAAQAQFAAQLASALSASQGQLGKCQGQVAALTKAAEKPLPTPPVPPKP